MRFHTGAIFFSLALVACSSEDDDAFPIGAGVGAEITQVFNIPDQVPSAETPVALLQDSGFDLTIEELRSRVVGAYTIVCDEQTVPPPTSFAEAKARALATIPVKDVGCRLEPGVTLRYSAWADAMLPLRDGWNEAALGRTLGSRTRRQDYERVLDVLGGEKTFLYHGTSTLGVLVAASPPAARFVVVQRRLRLVGQPPSCPTDAQLDISIQLLRDPEFQKAYLERPTSRLTDEMGELRRRFHVKFENHSYGEVALAAYQRACPTTQRLGDYSRANTELEALAAREREPNLFADVDILLTESAGNDGLLLDSAAQNPNCTLSPPALGPNSATLVVGSYGARDTPSTFSNRGPCVDLYAPGEYLVAPGIRGFYGAWSGTSFAAPMTLSVAMRLPLAMTAKERKAAVLARKDRLGRLSVDEFNRAIFYDIGSYLSGR